MPATLTTQDYDGIAKALVNALKTAGLSGRGNSSVGGSSGGANSSGQGTPSRTFSSSSQRMPTIKDIHQATAELKKLAEQTAKLTKDQLEYRKHIISSMNSLDLSERAMDKITKKIRDSLNAQTVFGRQLRDSIETFKDLENEVDRLTDAIAEHDELLKKTNAAKAEEIELNKDNLKILKDHYKHSKKALDVIKAAQRGDQQAKDKLKDMLANEDKKAKLSDDFIKNTGNQTATIAKNDARMKAFGDVLDTVGNTFGVRIGLATGALASFGVFLAGIKDLWGEFSTIAAAGMAGQAKQIAASAIWLGLSVEQLTAIIKENANTMNRMGPGKFMGTLEAFQTQMRGLGLSAEEASRGTAAMAGFAKASGVDPTNGKAMAGAIASQIDAWRTLRAVTGETAEEFAKNNQQILESTEYSAYFNGLSRKRQGLIGSEIIAERKRLAMMGYSTQTQIALMTKTRQLLNDKVSGRLQGSAKVLQAGSFLGMGNEASEIRRIMLKGRGASASEQSRMQDMLVSMNKAAQVRYQQAADSGDLGTQNVLDSLMENLETVMPSDVANKASREGVTDKLSREQLAAARANQEVPGYLNTTNIWLGRIMGFLHSGLGKIILGATGMVIAAILWSRRRGGGGAGGPGIFSRARDALGRGAGSVRDAGRGLWNGVKAGSARVASGLARGATAAVQHGPGMLRAVGGMAVRALPILAMGAAAWGAIKGVNAAEKAFKTQNATVGQRIAMGLAGAFTFGMASEETVASIGTNLYGWISGAGDKIKGWLLDGLHYLMDSLVPALYSGLKWLLRWPIDNLFDVIDDVKANGIASLFNGQGSSVTAKLGSFMLDIISALVNGLARGMMGMLGDIPGLGGFVKSSDTYKHWFPEKFNADGTEKTPDQIAREAVEKQKKLDSEKKPSEKADAKPADSQKSVAERAKEKQMNAQTAVGAGGGDLSESQLASQGIFTNEKDKEIAELKAEVARLQNKQVSELKVHTELLRRLVKKTNGDAMG